MGECSRPGIAITVNSPGEVATWLAPVLREIRRLDSRVYVTVFILPCTYAAGTEANVVRALPGVDAVLPPRASLKFALFGRPPRGWRPPTRGAVLFLGGEFWLGARIIRRLRVPGLAYSAGYINSAAAYSKVFAPRPSSKEELVRRGVPENSVDVVGDLMVDAARGEAPYPDRAVVRRSLGVEEGATLVALFPGSRPYEFRYCLGFFAHAAAEIKKRADNPGGLRFVAPVAPFIDGRVIREALRAVESEPGARAELDADRLLGDGEGVADGRFTFAGQAVSIRFVRDRSRAVIAGADLAITIPGSNNAELAAWGIPMVVCLPLHKPEEIAIDGILGLVDRIPLVGRKLKARAVLAAAAREQFVSLPNRIAREEIVPELRSRELRAEEVAAAACGLLASEQRRTEISRKLVAAMGPGGAARRVAEGVLEAAYRSAGK